MAPRQSGRLRAATRTKRAPTKKQDGDKRLQRVIALASGFYWEQDKHYRFVRIEGPTAELSREHQRMLIGKTRWELNARPLSPGGWAAHQAILDAHQSFSDFLLELTTPSGEVGVMSTNGVPMYDERGRFVGYYGIARDVTKQYRDEQATLRFTRMYAALGATNEAILRTKSPQDLYQRVCDAAVHGGRFRITTVLLPDEDTKWMRVAAVTGPAEKYMREVIRLSIDPDVPEGRGQTGIAFRTQEACVTNDLLGDPRNVAWHEHARKIGLLAAASVPLVRNGRSIGVLNFYAAEKDAFDVEIVMLLKRMADNVAFALENLEHDAERLEAEQRLRESEERFRSLTDLSSDWFWEQDAEFRFTKFEGKKVAGGRVAVSAMFIGKLPWELPGIVLESADWDRFRKTHIRHEPFRDFEWAYCDRTGNRFYVAMNGEPVFDASSRFVGYRGTARDITERKREEQLLALEHTITRRLADADSPSTALEGVAQLICETEGWETGEYWILDEHAEVLRYGGGWCVSDPAIKTFFDRSRGVTFERGVGLAGSVWASGEPMWISEVGRDPRVLRKDLAANAGLRSAILFPVTLDGKFIGVLDFSCRTARPEEPRYVTAMRVVGSQIGQFLHRKQTEQVLRESEERFRSLTELSSDWYWEMDTELRFTHFEGHGGRAMGQRYLGKTGRELKMIPERGWDEYDAVHRSMKPFRDLIVTGVERGEMRYAAVSGMPRFDVNGKHIGYRGITRNITDRKRAEAQIQYLATHDGLTALPNRTMFGQLLSHAIASAKRYRRNFAVFFIDLDRFKVINDTLGHEAGDTLLKVMAERLTESLRASDVVARLGGDEFVVLVQEVSEVAHVEAIARKILAATIKPMVIMGHEFRITASIGIAMYPQDGDNEQSLMKNADMAMYLAKEEGKNNFQFYSKGIKTQSLERLTLETNLRHALEREEFSLHYQAKVDLKTGTITGVEALIRWQNPALGSVSPMQFIPLAEETGLIVPIGRWVMRTACAQNVAWQRQGLPAICVAVNLSMRQFHDENLIKDIRAALEESQMRPELLELEITEGMVIQNVERAVTLLTAIKAMGVRLAIDDFGTGYSSLAQIKRFPIDTLKVDRSFIRDIPQETEDKAITQAIIAMGKTLSLTVVAEGVETEEQETFLREHACDEMQGYYFSKPVSADDFAALLLKHQKSN